MRQHPSRFRRLLHALRLGLLFVRASISHPVSDDSVPEQRADPGCSEKPSWSDEDVTLATVTAIADRATAAMNAGVGQAELPHPLVTDATLARHLGRATTAQLSIQAKRERPGVGLLLPTAAAQADLADALIHCLHQFDHRTKQQDQRIIELEAKLADVTRRLRSLETKLT